MVKCMMASGRMTRGMVNGDVYDGEYKDDKRNGRGKHTYANGDVYDGEWKDDKKKDESCIIV